MEIKDRNKKGNEQGNQKKIKKKQIVIEIGKYNMEINREKNKMKREILNRNKKENNGGKKRK